MFRDIDSPITLAFLTRFPSQGKADWLSPARLQPWLRSVGYYNPTNAPALHAHLTAAPRGTTGPEAAARAAITLALVTALKALRGQITALEGQIAAQLAAHPDGHIFTSLPRAGTVRAARLLAEIGRRPRALPHPGIPGLPGRGRPLDTTIGQGQGRLVPLGRRQAAARRRHRLRRRLPHRQRLGEGPLPASPRPRPRPHPRRPHPRPSLVTHHLAALRVRA